MHFDILARILARFGPRPDLADDQIQFLVLAADGALQRIVFTLQLADRVERLRLAVRGTRKRGNQMALITSDGLTTAERKTLEEHSDGYQGGHKGGVAGTYNRSTYDREPRRRYRRAVDSQGREVNRRSE